MAKNWDYDEVMRVIVKYKNRPVLWKVSHAGYGKHGPKTKAIRELASMFVDKSKYTPARPAHLDYCTE